MMQIKLGNVLQTHFTQTLFLAHISNYSQMGEVFLFLLPPFFSDAPISADVRPNHYNNPRSNKRHRAFILKFYTPTEAVTCPRKCEASFVIGHVVYRKTTQASNLFTL
ncbi:hypothetical protein ATANTOWER_030030 [Ataeniobius toweri]|uniref:Uncharacterized protein n=1 Tax=Ataeniobius toweri TaxID=208326 RepID=A0ABU7B9M5_9TELE|nr:hypothetical protein [Ataeniobius toweri]